MTAAGWSRPRIEAAVEWLIALLDARDPDTPTRRVRRATAW